MPSAVRCQRMKGVGRTFGPRVVSKSVTFAGLSFGLVNVTRYCEVRLAAIFFSIDSIASASLPD